ncbi:hypothetical protein BGHDH14_bgh01339 [Blumeria hordei DH14]|uniref:CENP-T/Histone H4 histone fold domain-containing protein n=1 Tax=Blumeria graminis f. sp. hordei (strain DH14) TaxID=546991 RepID=N1JD91_BLUG1|nr:hypothetical protein BGHDH14_bgh01339 [Blumeria hordei DH14]
MPETPSSRDSNIHKPSTPGAVDKNQAKLLRVSQRLGTARKTAAVTPHGRAAQRELELRRVGLTPRRGLRKSGVSLLKETPRDDLRALSRLLVAKSRPITQTPNATTLLKASEEEDDETISRPRFSLAIDQEGDEDDSLLLPPKSTGLEDDGNLTAQSVELARRFFDGMPSRRLSRGSFGSVRDNDAFFETSLLDPKTHTQDISRLDDFNAADLNNITTNYEVLGEDTQTLRMFKMNEARFSFVGRESGIRPLNLTPDDNDTFALKVPPREVSEQLLSKQGDILNEIEIHEAEEGDRTSGYEEADSQSKLVSVSADSTELELNTLENSSRKVKTIRRKEKNLRVSKYGIPYPSLPARVVKQLASNFARTSGNGKRKINKETLEAIMQATDWFFEQVADDLRAYANHAGRKTINDSDVIALMHR